MDFFERKKTLKYLKRLVFYLTLEFDGTEVFQFLAMFIHINLIVRVICKAIININMIKAIRERRFELQSSSIM